MLAFASMQEGTTFQFNSELMMPSCMTAKNSNKMIRLRFSSIEFLNLLL